MMRTFDELSKLKADLSIMSAAIELVFAARNEDGLGKDHGFLGKHLPVADPILAADINDFDAAYRAQHHDLRDVVAAMRAGVRATEIAADIARLYGTDFPIVALREGLAEPSARLAEALQAFRDAVGDCTTLVC